MKKLVLLLCLLAPMTLAAQAPAPALSLVNDPCAVANRTNKGFCTYVWNASTACCNPTFIAPKANCPQLCE